MHDTTKLRVAGRRIDLTHFKGVFAADLVPWTNMSPGSEWSVILNTDPSSLPGEHWVAVANKPDGRECWFFDLYRLKPTRYRPLLWQLLNKCQINTEDYQQDHSSVCGNYALFFLWLFHTTPRADVRRYFDPHDDAENDAAIHNTVHGWFPRLLNSERHDDPKTANGQGGGHAISPCAWENHWSCRHVVQRNRSRRGI